MEIDVRKFMTSKYPTDKYIQCPVPERCWSDIQEYADEYHQSKLKNNGDIASVSMIDNKYPRCKSCTKSLSQLELEQSKCIYCGRSC
jgi:hypothetical protein